MALASPGDPCADAVEDGPGTHKGCSTGYALNIIQVFQDAASQGELAACWTGDPAKVPEESQQNGIEWTIAHPFQVASGSGGPDAPQSLNRDWVPSLNLQEACTSTPDIMAGSPRSVLRAPAVSIPGDQPIVSEATLGLPCALSAPTDASSQARQPTFHSHSSLGQPTRGISITNIPTPFAFASKKTLAKVLEAGCEESCSGQSTPRELSVRGSGQLDVDALRALSASSPRVSDRRSASQRWRGAVQSIVTMSSVSKQFRTLRDMMPANQIHRESIKVVNVIGKGAFAIVERCIWQPKGGRPVLVAVKRLKPDLTRNDQDLKDLLQEVALLRKLKHRHVVKFMGYGYWEFATSTSSRQGSLFIVEELVDGGNLKTFVLKQMGDTKARHYRAADALRWLRQVAQGLAYLHRSEPQVIHRDLKLENILLKGKDVKTSEAKLADFGLSALVRRTAAYSDLERRIHTPADNSSIRRASSDMEQVWAVAAESRSRTPVEGVHAQVDDHHHHKLDVATGYEQLSGRTGTLMYMAPEVFNQTTYTEKADVFSWAIIAYELLHRYIMMTATDGSFEECKAYARRVSQGFRPPIHKDMPKQLAAMLTSSWSQDPANRPEMGEVAMELEHLANTLDLEAFDRAVLGKAYTDHLAAPADAQPSLCGCSIS